MSRTSKSHKTNEHKYDNQDQHNNLSHSNTLLPSKSNDFTNFENLFLDLHKEIQNYNNVIQTIQQFKSYIEQNLNDGIFDEEELKWINEDLENMTEIRDKKESEYLKKKEIYETNVLRLENILNKRKQIIDEADSKTGVFNIRPELLKKFAQKRALLMKMVDQGKRDLQQPLN